MVGKNEQISKLSIIMEVQVRSVPVKLAKFRKN